MFVRRSDVPSAVRAMFSVSTVPHKENQRLFVMMKLL
jgi:hypothetical protein